MNRTKKWRLLSTKRAVSVDRMAQSMRSEPFGVARAACFEELAGVFASSGALHYAKIFYPHRLCDFRLKLAQAISNFAAKMQILPTACA